MHATSATDVRARSEEVARVPEEPAGGDPMTVRRWALLVGGWLLVAAFLILIQRGRVTPTVFADELTYGRLAQNIGNGLGKTFNGLSSSQRTLYPYVIAPAWALFSGETAYRVALAINALVMSSAVLPTFALARTVTRFRPALVVAVLAGLIPSMAWAGMLMTESLAYPCAALALLAILYALRRPGPVTAGLAALAVIVTYFARTQMIAFGAILALAVVLEVVRHGRSQLKAQIVRHRWILSGGAAAVVLVLLVGRSRVAGGYSCVLNNPPGPGELAHPVLDYLGTFAIACGLLPAIGLVAMAVTPRAWRDDRSGPLLAVALSAAAVLIVQAAWTVVTTSPELQERYVFYAAPALLALLPALPGRVSARTLLIVTGVAVVYCALLFPGFADVTGKDIVDRVGLTGPLADALSNQHVLWAGATAVLGGLLFLALRTSASRAIAAGLALTAVFTIPVLLARQLDANSLSRTQAAEFQQPLSVVDQIAGNRTAAIVITRKSPLFPLYQLQLWNQSITRVFRVGVADEIGVGQACPVQVALDGTLSAKDACSGQALPNVLVLVNGQTPLKPGNGTVRTVGPGIRVWDVPQGQRPQLSVAGVKGGAPSLEVPPAGPPPQAPTGRCNGT